MSLADAATQAKRRTGSIKGGFFFRKELDEILAQPGCAGIRYYHGRNDKGEDTIIVVGVDGNGDDMANGMIMEDSFFCPPICGAANQLNT